MEQYKISFDEIKELLVEQKYHEEDIEELEKAFEFAKKLHAGQYRVSEEPYIIHPIEVVKILIGLRADKNTLIAGFLHDILEDTDTKREVEGSGERLLNELALFDIVPTEGYYGSYEKGNYGFDSYYSNYICFNCYKND